MEKEFKNFEILLFISSLFFREREKEREKERERPQVVSRLSFC